MVAPSFVTVISPSGEIKILSRPDVRMCKITSWTERGLENVSDGFGSQDMRLGVSDLQEYLLSFESLDTVLLLISHNDERSAVLVLSIDGVSRLQRIHVHLGKKRSRSASHSARSVHVSSQARTSYVSAGPMEGIC